MDTKLQVQPPSPVLLMMTCARCWRRVAMSRSLSKALTLNMCIGRSRLHLMSATRGYAAFKPRRAKTGQSLTHSGRLSFCELRKDGLARERSMVSRLKGHFARIRCRSRTYEVMRSISRYLRNGCAVIGQSSYLMRLVV